jgi:succinoglycan biosynthesis transport protein ExoP
MPLRPDMEPADFMDIFRRRKWLILFAFLLILFGTTVYCVLTPDVYQSTAKLLIIPPAVSEGMVRSTADTNTRDRLAIIQQDVLSRTQLMGVINEVGLSRLSRKGMSFDEAVNFMRKRISVEISSNTDRSINTFDLSFENESPQVAREVVSKLAFFFIQQNIKSREEITQETTKFLGTQLAETRQRLEAQEEKIKRYKLQYGGELPQQEQANLSRLQRLQDQIKNNGDAIARLQDRKVFLESQVSNMESRIQAAESQDPWETVGSGNRAGPGKLRSDLAAARTKLEELSQKYTPIHPAVVQARWEVEQLEAKIAELRQAARSNRAKSGAGSDNSAQVIFDPGSGKTNWETGEVQRLRQQVSGIDLDILALKRERASAQQTIEEIQRKVERLPQREQELVSLTRDYENIKKSYEELLDKKLKSNISENLEQTQKSERFQILEPANLPVKPIKPDRLKVLWLALASSLVIGVGGSVGLEVLDPTLRGSKEFKSFFEIPVLAALPVIQDDRYRRRIAVRRAAIVGGLVSIVGAYLVFLVVHVERIKMIIHTIGSGN